MTIFRDRDAAGPRLAKALHRFAGDPALLVLALPRGGVPVAAPVARALHAPLDVFLVRKLGLPGDEEFAMGALASGGVRVLNDEVVEAYGVAPAAIETVTSRESAELARREALYRAGRPPLEAKDRSVILVDDGVATGSTMFAAIQALRAMSPKRLVVAVPVAPPSTLRELETRADEVVCLEAPEPFYAIGRFYQVFDQTSDEEVRRALREAAPA
jgi:predicted phosphoribosyltransferase